MIRTVLMCCLVVSALLGASCSPENDDIDVASYPTSPHTLVMINGGKKNNKGVTKIKWIIVSQSNIRLESGNRIKVDDIHAESNIHDENAYSERLFSLVQKACSEHRFENLGWRDENGKKKVFLFYNKSMNIACYYTCDSMHITIKTEPYWRSESEQFISFWDALKERLQKNGFSYEYERKVLYIQPLLGSGGTKFTGDFVIENNDLITERYLEEYP